jgi:hypothetical protein
MGVLTICSHFHDWPSSIQRSDLNMRSLANSNEQLQAQHEGRIPSLFGLCRALQATAFCSNRR